MKALALRSSAATTTLASCGQSAVSSVPSPAQLAARASLQLTTVQPDGYLAPTKPERGPAQSLNGCSEAEGTDGSAAGLKVETSTNTAQLAKTEASNRSTPTEQREWISLNDLKKLLREKLTQTTAIPSGTCTSQGAPGDHEEAANEEDDSGSGSASETTCAANEACNAAQVLQDILRSRRIAAEDLECYPGKMPSLGALLHDEGLCKPCVSKLRAIQTGQVVRSVAEGVPAGRCLVGTQPSLARRITANNIQRAASVRLRFQPTPSAPVARVSSPPRRAMPCNKRV